MHISIGFSANLSVSVSVSVDTEINKNGLCICTGGYRDQLDGILGGGGGGVLSTSQLNSGKPPYTSTATGGGGDFWVSSDLNSGKKVRVFHWGGSG